MIEQSDQIAQSQITQSQITQARRRFLTSCGRFAALTPPAVTLLLSAADVHYAVAFSGTATGAAARGAGPATAPPVTTGDDGGGGRCASPDAAVGCARR